MSLIFQKPPQNYQYYVGLRNLVNYRFDAVNQTAPVTNGNLHTNLIIPARTFVQSGQLLDIVAFGNDTAHGASPATINALLNGTVIFSGTSGATATAHGWEFSIRIFCQDFVNNIAVLFGLYSTPHALVTTAAALAVNGSKVVLNPFGGAGFGFSQDNTLSFQCTDAAGAEVITQEFTGIYIQ